MKLGMILSIFCTCIFSSLFSQAESSQLAMDVVDVSEKIISQSPYLIKNSVADKIYLDEESVYLADDENYGYNLVLDDGRILYSPLIFFDEFGPFLSAAFEKFSAGTKPFKNICNNCGYEWCGGWLVLYCPKCGSEDFRSNVPNG